MARRSKVEASKTRTLILDTAEKAFLKKGFSGASLEDIAKMANVTRGAIYWHFKNKINLFSEMIERVKLPLDNLLDDAITDNNALENLKLVCIHSIKTLKHDERMRNVYTILLFKCEHNSDAIINLFRNMRSQVISSMEEIFNFAQSKGDIHKGVSPKVAAVSLYNFMQGIFYDFLSSQSCDLRVAHEELLELFFKGLSPKFLVT